MQNIALPATLPSVVSRAEFGVELERRRGLAKLSANEAARRAGITGQWWRQVERGLGGNSRRNIIAMARAIQWDVDDALAWAGEEEPATEVERRPRPPDPRELIDRSWPALSDQQREAVARTVETMADPFAVQDASRRGYYLKVTQDDEHAGEDAQEESGGEEARR